MSQERWDVVVRFLNGPLQFEGDIIMRGPVVRLGANPGPGGLKLEGYRGLDDRQAVITAYDGGSASIAPVGPNQVRMAPHEHVDWEEVHPLRTPTHLSSGCALHFGPPGRGATCVFVECRRLGVWEQRELLSDASQVDPQSENNDVKRIDSGGRFPWWLIPAVLAIFFAFTSALGLILFVFLQRDVDRLGPVDEGLEKYGLDAAMSEKVNTTLLVGVEDGFKAFVMKPNIDAAGWKELETPEKWDTNLIKWITRSETLFGKSWAVWALFDRSTNEYAQALAEMRKAGLPDVLAAIPFQESGYRAAPQSPVCAKGWWQFMPETAKRAGIEVSNCHFRGSGTPWSPTLLAPPRNAYKNADYVENNACKITTCDQDGRTDIRGSTMGAVKLLKEVYEDEELRYSGSLVQAVIASHNAGFDDSPYRNGVTSNTNVLIAYRRYRQAANVDRAPDFLGRNITCDTPEKMQGGPNDTCGGYLAKETQHYVHYIIAYQLLAACYYGKNYADDYPVFSEYREYSRANGYCKDINVPTKEEVQKRMKGGK